MEINIDPTGEARTDCATGADILGMISAGYHYCKDTSMLIKRIE